MGISLRHRWHRRGHPTHPRAHIRIPRIHVRARAPALPIAFRIDAAWRPREPARKRTQINVIHGAGTLRALTLRRALPAVLLTLVRDLDMAALAELRLSGFAVHALLQTLLEAGFGLGVVERLLPTGGLGLGFGEDVVGAVVLGAVALTLALVLAALVLLARDDGCALGVGHLEGFVVDAGTHEGEVRVGAVAARGSVCVGELLDQLGGGVFAGVRRGGGAAAVPGISRFRALGRSGRTGLKM